MKALRFLEFLTMSAISTPHGTAGRLALVGAISAVLMAPPAIAAAAADPQPPASTAIAGSVPTGDREAPAPARAADRVAERAWPGAAAGVSRGASAGVPERSMRAERTRQRASFAHYTLRSRATRDLRGVEPSLYRGRYFVPRLETMRRCIVRRESMGHYDVISPSGSYFGAYQVSRPLARGATWMMLPEHRRLLGAKVARRILADLRDRPMSTWPRYWQDAAFSTVMNWEHPGSGASHWAGGRWHC